MQLLIQNNHVNINRGWFFDTWPSLLKGDVCDEYTKETEGTESISNPELGNYRDKTHEEHVFLRSDFQVMYHAVWVSSTARVEFHLAFLQAGFVMENLNVLMEEMKNWRYVVRMFLLYYA